MTSAQVIFWCCVAAVGYTYLVYPLILAVLARVRGRAVRREPFGGSVSVIVAAHNEQRRIAGRRDELIALLDASGLDGEVIIVSDGSTDATAALALQDADPRVRVIELSQNVGKAQALTRACAAAKGVILIFADARQRWAADSIRQLLENFADPRVGGASGELCLQAASGATAGVGLYWRYEKAIRKLESRIHSTVGATGAICAVRRQLFQPIPPRTILDDVYWPMRVAMQGYRVVHDGTARAFDRLPDSPGDEFRRKVRTLSGNFQLVCRLPALLLPWRNPLWWQFLSHKLMRLAVPWLLIAMLVISVMLSGPVYRFALAAQVLGYLLAIAAVYSSRVARFRLASVAASFLVLNAAACVAFWVWAFGRTGSSWRKVVYAAPPTAIARLQLADRQHA